MDALTYRGFSFAYPRHAPVLAEADWSVPAGAFAVLVGDTGSGKTTLLRCAKPELAPTGERTGEVRLWGEPLAAGEREPRVGYVSQDADNQIVCDKVWHELAFGLENLGVAPDDMRRRVAEVAHFFGMEPWFRRSAEELSGGQKALVCLASVLVMQPSVLLLDEPTAQLDPVAQKSFLHALFRLNRELGLTVVVATHSPETMVDYATMAARVEGGRVTDVPLGEFRYGRAAGLRPATGDVWDAAVAQDARAVGSARDTWDAAVAWGAQGAAGREPGEPSAALGAPAGRAERGPGGAAARAASPAVSFSDAWFRYDRGADWVLRGLDLTLGEGLIHAVVGGNGCGKSTMLRALAGTLRLERGRVANALRADQALLPQNPKMLLVCDTVAEELTEWAGPGGYGADAIARVTARLGLEGLGDRHPYDLSGGQQQKLALAKLLLIEPRLLLMDEPTKGLDAPSRLEIARILRGLRDEGRTLVMVTHDLAFASRVADTVTMLFDGEAACTQPPAEFCARNLFYRPQPDGFTVLWDAQVAQAQAANAVPAGGAPRPDEGVRSGAGEGRA